MRAMKAMRKRDFGELAWALPIIQHLREPRARAQFDAAVADLSFIDTSYDPAGWPNSPPAPWKSWRAHARALRRRPC